MVTRIRQAGCVFQSTLSVRRATAEPAKSTNTFRFQSTLSVRRATGMELSPRAHEFISIHALREESDANRRNRSWTPMYFNPRSP